GAAVYNNGFYGSAGLWIISSTLRDNSADYLGGGIFNDGVLFGGAPSLQIFNSTFSGNSSLNSYGGGIYNYASGLRVVNSTFTGNHAPGGSSICNDSSASLEIASTILNVGPSDTNILNISGTVSSLGYNLSSDNGGGFLTAIRDQINK